MSDDGNDTNNKSLGSDENTKVSMSLVTLVNNLMIEIDMEIQLILLILKDMPINQQQEGKDMEILLTTKN